MVGWRGGGFGSAPLPRVYTNYEKTALSRTVLGESCGETISFTVGVLCSECSLGLKWDWLAHIDQLRDNKFRVSDPVF